MKLTRGELNLSNYSPYKECGMFVLFARQRQGCEGWPQHPGLQIMGATLGFRPSAGPMLRNNGAWPRKCAQFLLHCKLGAAEGWSPEAAPSFCCIVSWEPQRAGMNTCNLRLICLILQSFLEGAIKCTTLWLIFTSFQIIEPVGMTDG